jgi:hypothetical protein
MAEKDGISSGGFSQAASGSDAGYRGEQRRACTDTIAEIYKYSQSDSLISLLDYSHEINASEGSFMQEYMGDRFKVNCKIGDQGNHDFEVRLKEYKKGSYSIALYEGGSHAGTAKTPDVNKSPTEIYKDNPLNAPPSRIASASPTAAPKQ